MDIDKSTIVNDGRYCCVDIEYTFISKNVSDLEVVVDSYLRLNEHIAKFTHKAHQRDSLIYQSFTSKNCIILLKASKTYICPILEFNSPVWFWSVSYKRYSPN